MELRHLRYFVRVAEERHFGRAATELGISQPPLSQQIRALEAELGITLFSRTSRRVELTEEGKLFLPEARAVLDQARHAIDVARRVQHGELGELSIAFSSSVPFIPIVAQTLAGFRRDYPAVHLSLSEQRRETQLEGLAQRTFDIGFLRSLGRPEAGSEIEMTELLAEPLMIAVREDHPLALLDRPLKIADLVGVPLVLYQQMVGAGFNNDMAALFRRHGHDFPLAQEVGGLGSLLGVVAAGLGVTIMAQSIVALHADQVVYRLLDEQGALSHLWLVHRRQMSHAARNFLDLLEDTRAAERATSPVAA